MGIITPYFLSHISHPVKGVYAAYFLTRRIEFMDKLSPVASGRTHQVEDVPRKDDRVHERVSAVATASTPRLDPSLRDPRIADAAVLSVPSRSDDKSTVRRTDDLRERLSTKRKADDDEVYPPRGRDDVKSVSREYDDKRARLEREDRGYDPRSYDRGYAHSDVYRRRDETRYDSRYQPAARAPEVKPPAAQATLPRDYDALIRHPETIKADHTITIQSRPDAPYMKYLRTGEKTAECRVNGRMYQNLREGNIILFHNRQEGIFCKIIFLHTYKTFEEMIKAEGATNLLPQLKLQRLSEADLLRRAINTYEGFPGSHNVRQWGSIAIGVKYLCDKPQQR